MICCSVLYVLFAWVVCLAWYSTERTRYISVAIYCFVEPSGVELCSKLASFVNVNYIQRPMIDGQENPNHQIDGVESAMLLNDS